MNETDGTVAAQAFYLINEMEDVYLPIWQRVEAAVIAAYCPPRRTDEEAMNTSTPRTDAFELDGLTGCYGTCDSATYFARQLERELAEARAELLSENHRLGDTFRAEQEKLLALNDEAKLENERLREAILSVCCNPDGIVCISGSDGDRKVLQGALTKEEPK